MTIRKAAVVLIIAVPIVLGGCAGLKKSGRSHRYLFVSQRPFKTEATVMSRREIHTTVEFWSNPQGSAVYAYDERTGKKSTFLGRTPCRYNVMTYSITDYADMSKEYEVIIDLPAAETASVDYFDPENTWGEITFSFLLDKRGYEPLITRVGVQATNEILVRALSGQLVPSYTVEAALERKE